MCADIQDHDLTVRRFNMIQGSKTHALTSDAQRTKDGNDRITTLLQRDNRAGRTGYWQRRHWAGQRAGSMQETDNMAVHSRERLGVRQETKTKQRAGDKRQNDG